MLRELRTTAGFTQHDLSRRLGVGERSIQRIERGDFRPRDDLIESWERVCRLNATSVN